MSCILLRVLAPLLCAYLWLSACATRPDHEHHSTDVDSAGLKSGMQVEETSRGSLGSQEVGEVKTTGACMNFKGILEPIIKAILGVKKGSVPPASSIRVPATAGVFSCPSDFCIDVYMEDGKENLAIQSVTAKLLEKAAEDVEKDENFAGKVGDALGVVEGSTTFDATNTALRLVVRLNSVTWNAAAIIKNTCLSLHITVTIPQLRLTVAGGKSKVESDPQNDWTISIDPNSFKLCGSGKLNEIAEGLTKAILKISAGKLGEVLVGELKGQILTAIGDALNKQTGNPLARGALFMGGLIPRLVGAVDKSQSALTGHRAFDDKCN